MIVVRRLKSGFPMRRARRAACALLVAAAGCSSSGGSTAPTNTTPVLKTLTVTLGESTLSVGSTTTARVAGTDQNGSPIAVSGIAWTTSNPSVASVTGGGIVRGVAAGTTEVIATVGSIDGRASLTVAALVPGAALR